jgi:hypothetical protein
MNEFKNNKTFHDTIEIIYGLKAVNNLLIVCIKTSNTQIVLTHKEAKALYEYLGKIL